LKRIQYDEQLTFEKVYGEDAFDEQRRKKNKLNDWSYIGVPKKQAGLTKALEDQEKKF